MSDYSKDMFKQLTEVMERCEKLDNKITDIMKEHKKEIMVLNDKIDMLTKENKRLILFRL
jgi:GTP-binding protein EngB required for normal cell division